MKKRNILLCVLAMLVGSTLTGIGLLRHKNKKEVMLGFDDDLFDSDSFEDDLSEKKSLLCEMKEDIERNTDEITSLWDHIETLSKSKDNIEKDIIDKDIIKKDRG